MPPPFHCFRARGGSTLRETHPLRRKVETPLDKGRSSPRAEGWPRPGRSCRGRYLHSYRDGVTSVAPRLSRAFFPAPTCAFRGCSRKSGVRTWDHGGERLRGTRAGGLSRRLDTRLGRGYAGRVLIMHHRRRRPPSRSVRLAAGAVLSGPAGGIAGSGHCARCRRGNLITFDMGGTSTDIALLEAGPHLTATRRWPAARWRCRHRHPHAGRGGGSMRGWMGGHPHGPRERGRGAGPRLLWAGGDDATVTDANVTLGLLDPANSWRANPGTRRPPSRGGRRARALGVDTVRGEGHLRVVNTNMAEGIRLVCSPGRGSPALRPPLVRRRGRLHITEWRACGGHPGDRPAGGVRPVGLGMLAPSSLRDVRTHGRGPRDGRSPSAAFSELEARAARLGSFAGGRSRCALRGHALRRADLRDLVPLDGVDMMRPTHGQVVARFHARQRRSTPTARPARKVLAREAGVVGGCPLSRGRGGGPAPPPPRPAPPRIWAAGWSAVPYGPLPPARRSRSGHLRVGTTTVVIAPMSGRS